jgi:hypothetical protein
VTIAVTAVLVVVALHGGQEAFTLLRGGRVWFCCKVRCARWTAGVMKSAISWLDRRVLGRACGGSGSDSADGGDNSC